MESDYIPCSYRETLRTDITYETVTRCLSLRILRGMRVAGLSGSWPFCDIEPGMSASEVKRSSSQTSAEVRVDLGRPHRFSRWPSRL